MEQAQHLLRATVSVVILNWEAADETRACVEHLGPPPEGGSVVVVDNGSREPLALGDLPWVHVVRNEENLGFGPGNNRALRQLLKEAWQYVLLLNNDARATWPQVGKLVESAQATRRCGAVGPVVLERDGSIQSAGIALSRWTARPRPWKATAAEPEPDSLSGCCLLLSAQALRDVGIFDERFFLFAEEKDLCVRIRKGGYSLKVQPAVRVQHAKSLTANRQPRTKYYHMMRSNVLFLRKWRKDYPLVASLPVLLVASFVGWMLARERLRRSALQGYFAGLRDGLREAPRP